MSGIVKKVSDKGPSDPFTARMRMQVFHILDNAFPGYGSPEREKFALAYMPILTNLEQCQAARDDIQALWNDHAGKVLNGTIADFDGNTIHVDSIDNDLDRLVKEFFNRGKNALDLLDKLKPWMGFSMTPFNRGKPDFQNAKVTLLSNASAEDREFFESVVDFIDDHRQRWLSAFVNKRIDIEHRGWHVPHVNYVPINGRVELEIPQIDGSRLDETLEKYWNAIFYFCETMIVEVALGRHIKPPRILVPIPPENRDPSYPIRYDVRIGQPG